MSKRKKKDVSELAWEEPPKPLHNKVPNPAWEALRKNKGKWARMPIQYRHGLKKQFPGFELALRQKQLYARYVGK